jgi:invasion protein IalB
MKLRFTPSSPIAALAAIALLSFGSFGASAQQNPQRPAQPQRPAAQPAPAQPQAPTAVKVALKPAPDQQEWIKICGEDPSAGNKTVCFTTRDFVAENNQPVMGVAIFAEKDGSNRFARILVPLTFMIQPGIRISTEGLNPIAGRFQICIPQGCFVQADLNDAAINALKRGQIMRIDMQNQLQQEVNFEVPLAGFSKAYDSAGIDQATLQRMQEEAVRQQQQQQQGQQPGSDDLRRRGEELLRQRQGAPQQ